MNREIVNLHDKIKQFLKTKNTSSYLSDELNPATESNSRGNIGFVTNVENLASRDFHSKILLPLSCKHANNLDAIFFGTTNIFSRLVTRRGALPIIPGGLPSLPLSSEPLLQRLSKSLSLDQNMIISQTEAQDLAWYYHRSVELTY